MKPRSKIWRIDHLFAVYHQLSTVYFYTGFLLTYNTGLFEQEGTMKNAWKILIFIRYDTFDRGMRHHLLLSVLMKVLTVSSFLLYHFDWSTCICNFLYSHQIGFDINSLVLSIVNGC